jgi:hypothetical protein
VTKGALRFTSDVPASRKDEVERLVFFNENQHRVEARLREALQTFGAPAIVVEMGRVRFTVGRAGRVQTIYAMDESRRIPQLAGALLFTRESAATMTVLFVAVREDYVWGGARAAALVAPRLLEVAGEIAARTRGVAELRLAYHPRDLRVPVRHAR